MMRWVMFVKYKLIQNQKVQRSPLEKSCSEEFRLVTLKIGAFFFFFNTGTFFTIIQGVVPIKKACEFIEKNLELNRQGDCMSHQNVFSDLKSKFWNAWFLVLSFKDQLSFVSKQRQDDRAPCGRCKN